MKKVNYKIILNEGQEPLINYTTYPIDVSEDFVSLTDDEFDILTPQSFRQILIDRGILVVAV